MSSQQPVATAETRNRILRTGPRRLPEPDLAENPSGPLREVGLVVSNPAVLEHGHAAAIILREGAAGISDGVPPSALVFHPRPAGQPVVDVLPNSGELQPALGEELHHAAVSVHENHVRELSAVCRYHNIC